MGRPAKRSEGPIPKVADVSRIGMSERPEVRQMMRLLWAWWRAAPTPRSGAADYGAFMAAIKTTAHAPCEAKPLLSEPRLGYREPRICPEDSLRQRDNAVCTVDCLAWLTVAHTAERPFLVRLGHVGPQRDDAPRPHADRIVHWRPPHLAQIADPDLSGCGRRPLDPGLRVAT